MIITPRGEINVAAIAQREQLDIWAGAHSSLVQPGLFVISDRREFGEDEEPDAAERFLRALSQTATSTGINMRLLRVPSPYDIPYAVKDAARDPEAHGILVPVPLSLEAIDEIAKRRAASDKIIGSIPRLKDVDGLLPGNIPATSEAAMRVLRAVEQEIGMEEPELSAHIDGGRGHVGKGLAQLLENAGYEVTVSDIDTPYEETRRMIGQSGILFSATGVADKITADYFRYADTHSPRIIVNIGRGQKPDGKLGGDLHTSAIDLAIENGWYYTNKGLAVGKLATLLVMRRTKAARDSHPTFEPRTPRLSTAVLQY